MKSGEQYCRGHWKAVIWLLAMSWVFATICGCGKARIIQETNAVSSLAHSSIDSASQISILSSNPAVVSHARDIISDQRKIVSRTVEIERATTHMEDKADGYLSWWGEFFVGSANSIKWLGIAAAAGVVAFIGFRARLWSFIGGFLPSRKEK